MYPLQDDDESEIWAEWIFLFTAYRIGMPITEKTVMSGSFFYICPRCGITLEHDFMAFCDRCGQRLDWRNYKKARRRGAKR